MPYSSAFIRQRGGFFGPNGKPAPDTPLDETVLSKEDLAVYVDAFERTRFFGINSFYMNDSDNRLFFEEAPSVLEIPVLYLAGEKDLVCHTEHSKLAEPMKKNCRKLTYRVLNAGHWLPQEAHAEVNDAISDWIDRAAIRT